MFDEIIRAVERLKTPIRVSITLPTDDAGYLDRRCPHDHCCSLFKVLMDDWSEKVRDEEVFCPICREAAPCDEWHTPSQQDYVKKVAIRHMHQRLNNALSVAARRTRPVQMGWVSMSLSFRPGALPIVLPLRAAEVMQLRSACEVCGCRYASVGASFFCPACGHNSAISTFTDAVATVRATIAELSAIDAAMTAGRSADAAASAIRQVTESSLERLVASFQRFAEATFGKLPGAAQVKVRRNTFQNVDEGDALWTQATGTGYGTFLNATELVEMGRLFQQRHLLAHREGIVDQGYLDKSGDVRWQVGQRPVVRADDVLRLADLVSRLGAGLQSLVPPETTSGVVGASTVGGQPTSGA